MTWNTAGIRRVVLYDKHGNAMQQISDVVAFCDVPFTSEINEDFQVYKVRFQNPPQDRNM